MNTFEAAKVTQMTAAALNTAPTTPAAQQQLWRQCNRFVVEKRGRITATTSSGGECSPQEKRAFSTYYSRHNPGGIVIVFDLSKEAPVNGRNSFYIASSEPNRVVLLVNGSNLPGDLAIVTSLPLAIEGGLNILGTPKAVSITAQSVFGVPVECSLLQGTEHSGRKSKRPMSHENPPRSDQFWMADPLNILVQTVLTKAFNLEDAEIDVANEQVLQYIEFLSQSKTLEEAWQQRSFYEFLLDNAQADENALRSSHDLFISIFRNNRQMAQTAIDFETYFPPALNRLIFRRYLSRSCRSPTAINRAIPWRTKSRWSPGFPAWNCRCERPTGPR